MSHWYWKHLTPWHPKFTAVAVVFVGPRLAGDAQLQIQAGLGPLEVARSGAGGGAAGRQEFGAIEDGLQVGQGEGWRLQLGDYVFAGVKVVETIVEIRPLSSGALVTASTQGQSDVAELRRQVASLLRPDPDSASQTPGSRRRRTSQSCRPRLVMITSNEPWGPRLPIAPGCGAFGWRGWTSFLMQGGIYSTKHSSIGSC